MADKDNEIGGAQATLAAWFAMGDRQQRTEDLNQGLTHGDIPQNPRNENFSPPTPERR